MKLSMRYIILYVNNLQKSTEFYQKTLNLTLKGDHGTYIEFDTGNTLLGLIEKEHVAEMTGLPVNKKDRVSPTFEIAFVVDNVNSTIEKLRSLEVPILVETIVKPWGQKVAYIADPDGHFIEICSPME